jgi:predicted DsbA family dithiol-disulfide isomerase
VILFRAASLLALGTSVALLLDYTRPDPAFCGLGSGCGAVRHSGLGYIPLGFGQLPVPVLGVLAFSLLFASTLQRSGEMRGRVAGPLAYAGALVAAVLIGIQFFIGHFCSLCMAADLSALVIGLCAYRLSGGGWEEAQQEEESDVILMDPLELMSEGQRVKGVWRDDSQVYDAPNPLVRPAPPDPFRLQLSAWISLAILTVLAPVCFPLLVKTTEVPPVIRALYRPDEITVVEFFDFQCPHCQHLSPRLKKLVAGDPQLSLRYGYTPLPSHKDARGAARVAICAAEQGKEFEVAAVFFEQTDFSLPALKKLASSITGDGKVLDECLKSKRPDQRIESDTAALKKAGFVGLPTTYVGATRILGSQEDIVYRDAIRRAVEGSDRSGLNPWAYWGAILLLIIGVIMMGRVRPSDRQSIPG